MHTSPSQLADGANHNLVFFLACAISADEARRLAFELGTLVGDGAGNRGDPGHVWRVPGTLNWPTQAKLMRGRSRLPAVVGMGRPGPAVAAAVLREALAGLVAPQEEKDSGGVPKVTPTLVGRERSRRGGFSGDTYGDNPTEMLRAIDALCVLSNHCDRNAWRLIISQLCDFSQGDWRGRELARWFSEGGHLQLQRLFLPDELSAAVAGARSMRGHLQEMIDKGVDMETYADFDEAEFEREWLHACRCPHGTIAGLFETAKKLGWNAERGRWGLTRVRNVKPLSSGAQDVLEAAANIPKGKGRAIDYQLGVWLSQIVCRYDGRSADYLRVAVLVSRHINAEKGFGWGSSVRLARMLGWCAESADAGAARVRRVLRDLAAGGFLKLSDGRRRGAHGGEGPSYAPTFPDSAWDDVMLHDKRVISTRTGEFVPSLAMPPAGPQREAALSAALEAMGGCKPLQNFDEEVAQIGTSQAHSSPPLAGNGTLQAHSSRCDRYDRRGGRGRGRVAKKNLV